MSQSVFDQLLAAIIVRQHERAMDGLPAMEEMWVSADLFTRLNREAQEGAAPSSALGGAPRIGGVLLRRIQPVQT